MKLIKNAIIHDALQDTAFTGDILIEGGRIAAIGADMPAPAGMEKLSAVTARLGAFLEQMRPEAEERDILVSTHAIALKGALEYLTPASRGSYWAKNIGNCAVYRTAPTAGGYLVPELWLSGV